MTQLSMFFLFHFSLSLSLSLSYFLNKAGSACQKERVTEKELSRCSESLNFSKNMATYKAVKENVKNSASHIKR